MFMKYDYNPTSFLGKCGNDCGSCPLHKNNLLTMEDRIKTAQGCYKYEDSPKLNILQNNLKHAGDANQKKDLSIYLNVKIECARTIIT